MMARMDRTRFERGTAVEPRGGAGEFRAFVGEEWNCPVVPHGGLVPPPTEERVPFTG